MGKVLKNSNSKELKTKYRNLKNALKKIVIIIDKKPNTFDINSSHTNNSKF
jgi:hypothetical protein